MPQLGGLVVALALAACPSPGNAWVQRPLRRSAALAKPTLRDRLPSLATDAATARGAVTVLSASRFQPGSGVYEGIASLVEERDACGVGFVAQPGKASHDVITRATHALGCMEHRGACAADGKSGDGSGLLTEVPWKLIRAEVPEVAAAHEAGRTVGVGMLFLDQDESKVDGMKALVEEAAAEAGFDVLAWRALPVDRGVLGEASADTVPTIAQVYLSPGAALVASTAGAGSYSVAEGKGMERALYLLRRRVRAMADAQAVDADGLYVASMSSRTVTYKGMVAACDLSKFYRDLEDDRFEARFAIYHRRFSTNTMPKWPLAQPMRMLGHNGEINTLLGNVNWMRARAGAQEACDITAMLEGGEGALQECDQFSSELGPLVDTGKSDSANLDSILELYSRAGRGVAESLMLMVPQAFENGQLGEGSDDVAAFLQYHAPLQEAWDGPALIVFSDGERVGACLDRNGLRPARVTTMRDGTVYLMSETGVIPGLDEADVASKGRLGPGQMVAVDLASGAVLDDAAVKREAAGSQPWAARLKATQTALPRLPFKDADDDAAPSTSAAGFSVAPDKVVPTQTAFGWGAEDVAILINDMAASGVEATFSMGDDAPLAFLSERPHVPYDYFRQRFAQVTNPPIDPLREGEVMSLKVSMGRRGHVLTAASQDSATCLATMDSPVLHSEELAALRAHDQLQTETLSTLYARPGPGSAAAGGGGDEAGLADAVAALTARAVALVEGGADVVVLSDLGGGGAGGGGGVDADTLYVPPLVAVGAVHHALIGAGLRMQASLVVETGQCWSTHHVACLVGYGASAVHPYLAFDAVRTWFRSKQTQAAMARGALPAGLTEAKALANLRAGLDKGLLKILSKMGISLVSSYQGAQIFEALGIGGDLLEVAFKGTPSRVGGLDTADLGRELLSFHGRAFGGEEEEDMLGVVQRLVDDGFVKPKASKEHHSNSPQLAKLLHKAVRNEDTAAFREWSDALGSRPLTALRDLLELAPNEATGRAPVPLAEVEPVEAIMQRFCTGGMSLGALSRECHEVLAIAMNRVGGKSNSGEGGEDEVRNKVIDDADGAGKSAILPHLKGGLKNGDRAASKIKQVASGRFGVTPAYLAGATQLEIKIAQGAKPGEGGQLPGPKVSGYIAAVRGSTPGVTLISPPPHHDIYSIEDLAQLIFDLKAVNPRAPVSVKLVAEPGIGTVAAGVAKANADVVQVSGHDGGTGASPLSSIKHAGSSWELGVAEAHSTLVTNGLRSKVLLRVDGGIRTGLDVVMAALLGGEEFGFGTTAMVAAGCVMARVCHLNSCPVGVTTQRPELREKFPGVAQDVVNFLAFVAEEVRWYLASMGYKSLDEVVGQGGALLQPKAGATLAKTSNAATAFLTDLPTADRQGRPFAAPNAAAVLAATPSPNLAGVPMFDDALLAAQEGDAAQGGGRVAAALAGEPTGPFTVALPVVNTDRSVGTRLSGAIALAHGDAGLPEGAGPITLALKGSAGQSLGAFNVPGLDISLEGEANDYVGKGIKGGTISLRPPAELVGRPGGWPAEDQTICGNTCLYGATGGKFFARGRAGERFAVRNSGALAVVEGSGDHCLEYMTNGAVVVLGPVGRNVGAGMTGGLGFFYSPGGGPPPILNKGAGLATQRVVTAAGAALVRGAVEEHVAATGSELGARLLADWDTALGDFWIVVPASELQNPAVAEPAEEKEVAAVA